MAKAKNRPVEWVETSKGDYPITHECPLCGMPRSEMKYGKLGYHLPNCEERDNESSRNR